MKRLLQYFDGYRKESVLGPLFKLCEALLELTVPLIVAKVIDTTATSKSQGVVIQYIGLMLAVGTIGLVFSLTAQYFSAKAAVGFTRQLNEALFTKVLALPQQQVDNTSPASLVNRLTSDTFQMQTGINVFFRLFLRSPFIVIGSLIMAMQIDRRVTLIFVGMIILLFIVVGSLLWLTSPMFSQVRELLDRLVQQTRQQIKGMRVIRAFRQEQREINDFATTNQQIYEKQLKVSNLSILTNPLTYVVVNLSLVLVLWQSGNWVNEGSLTQGSVVALVNYLLQILVELVKLTMVVSTINKSVASAKRVSDVLAMEEEKATFDTDEVTNAKDLYQFEKVNFSYLNNQEPVLKDITFNLEKNQFLGIIGSTGSGKSALLSLITKTYDISSGRLSINHQFLDTTTRHSLRQAISLVPQTAALFTGTVRSNLLLAYPNASEDEMWQALEVAQAADFIRQKDGLDTTVELFGRNFSGGQRQRLTIARALIKPAEIYIFDDSTSALDYLTEANFQKAVSEYLANKTMIMISQRTHSVQEADKILVLDEGNQVGFDTHDELLKSCAVYKEIYESQQVQEVSHNEA